MNAASPDRPSPGPRSGRRLLFGLLAAAAALYLVSLPWQRRQWADVARIDDETARQQARAREMDRAGTGIAAAEARLRQNPNDAAAQLTLAGARVGRGDVPGALELLSRLERSAAPSAAPIAEQIAGLYQQVGYTDRALVMARVAHRLAPTAPPALLRLGLIEFQLGWKEQGAARIREAQRRAPKTAEPRLALALIHDLTGDLEDAARELEAAQRLRPQDWRIQLLVAQNLQARRRYDEALETLESALRLAPDEPELQVRKARFLLDQARRHPRNGAGAPDRSLVLRAAERALTLDPRSAEAYYVLGAAYRDQNRDAEARQAWEKALVLAPGFSELGYQLGRLLIERGERARGQRLIDEDRRARAEAAEFNRLVIVAGTDPKNPAHHRHLARWCMMHGRLARAILEWQEVLDRLPHDAEARQGLQAARARRGDPAA